MSKEIMDQNESLIAEATRLIMQLENIGCPKRLIEDLRQWNLDRVLDLAKYKKWIQEG